LLHQGPEKRTEISSAKKSCQLIFVNLFLFFFYDPLLALFMFVTCICIFFISVTYLISDVNSGYRYLYEKQLNCRPWHNNEIYWYVITQGKKYGMQHYRTYNNRCLTSTGKYRADF
jgi:hypothetical protein